MKPYVLLRDALESSGMVGLVKVAIRNREQLATLRVRDGVIVLETMIWPDEVREPAFGFLDEDVDAAPAGARDGRVARRRAWPATSTRAVHRRVPRGAAAGDRRQGRGPRGGRGRGSRSRRRQRRRPDGRAAGVGRRGEEEPRARQWIGPPRRRRRRRRAKAAAKRPAAKKAPAKKAPAEGTGQEDRGTKAPAKKAAARKIGLTAKAHVPVRRMVDHPMVNVATRRSMLHSGRIAPRAATRRCRSLDHSEVETMWPGDYVDVARRSRLFVRTHAGRPCPTPNRRCSSTASAARPRTGPTSPPAAHDLAGRGARSARVRALRPASVHGDYSIERARRRRDRLPRAVRARAGAPVRQLDGRRDLDIVVAAHGRISSAR